MMPYQPYQSTWQNPYTTTNPYGQSPILPTVQPYQQPVNGVIKVNGRDSAMQYNLPPNSTSPALFDNSGTCFYIVSTDGTGMKTVETFDFTQHVEQQPVQIDGAQFVSKQEYDQFVAKVSAALEAINGVHAAVPATGTANATEGADGAAPLDAARGHVGSGQQPSSI